MMLTRLGCMRSFPISFSRWDTVYGPFPFQKLNFTYLFELAACVRATNLLGADVHFTSTYKTSFKLTLRPYPKAGAAGLGHPKRCPHRVRTEAPSRRAHRANPTTTPQPLREINVCAHRDREGGPYQNRDVLTHSAADE